MPNLLSEIEYFSFLNYHSKGTSNSAKKSRMVRDALKNIDTEAIPKVVAALAKYYSEGSFGNLLTDAVLVPAPRSAPLLTPDSAWPCKVLCEEMLKHGLGNKSIHALVRHESVAKSSFQTHGNRPPASIHFKSLKYVGGISSTDKVVIVDDILTKGATMLAMASHLAESAKVRNIACFALMRTRNFLEDIDKIIEITRGQIVYDAGSDSVRRLPD